MKAVSKNTTTSQIIEIIVLGAVITNREANIATKLKINMSIDIILQNKSPLSQ
jgi:hypothetical protein